MKNAFPSKEKNVDARGVPIEYTEKGMTLRDFFAAKAMQAILGNPHVNKRSGPMCEAGNEYIAKWAYEQADHMLKARE